MAEKHYDFFQNRLCEYYPCHPGADPETFSCLFCYCPLYALGDRCGGNFHYTPNGIKDCTHCLRPHIRENYSKILEKMPEILELAKKDRGMFARSRRSVLGSIAKTPQLAAASWGEFIHVCRRRRGRDMPKVFGSKARVCDRPIFFLWSNMVRGSSLYCLLFCI